MFINFRATLVISLLFLGQIVFAQSDKFFTHYLEGDYHTITANATEQNLIYLASAYAHLDDYQTADSLFDLVDIETRKSALFLNEKGFLLLKMYQLDQAKADFEDALTLSQKQNNQEGLRLANTNLGLYHFATGNFELQLQFSQKALDYSRELYGDQSIITARMLNNLALALSGLEKTRESLNFYEQVLTLYQTKKEAYINPYICRTKINIALLKLKENDDLSAEKSALDALNYTNNESNNMLFVYISLGTIYTEKKELQFAENYLFDALKLNQHDHIKERIEIFNRIADVARLKQDYAKASSYLDSAITLNVLDYSKNGGLDNLLSMDASLSSYYIKGQTDFDRYYKKSLKVIHLKDAVTSFEHCILILDEERKLRITQKDKIRLGYISKGIYDKLIKGCFDLSINTFNRKFYEEQVFLHIQQSKATVLNASLNENDALHFSGVPQNIIDQERSMKADLMYYEQLVTSNQSARHYSDSLSLFRKKYRRFIDNIEKDYPRYYSLKYRKNIKSAIEIQSSLSENKVLCSYYLTSDASMIYIACLDNKSLNINEVYAGEHLLREITKMRNFIFHRIFKGYNKLSHHLFSLLIPDKKFLEGKSVVFFPDGALSAIPFETLSTRRVKKTNGWEDEPFLIRKTIVSYGASTALYEPYVLSELSNYDLFAPLTFNYSSKMRYKGLPFTENEVLAIDSVTNNAKVQVFLGVDANRENVIQSDANIIHLATHGLIDQEHPQLSKLCLSPHINGDFLYNNDIYNLNINSDLVTMSACETGLGKVSKGEGVIGLTRAWIYAGTKNIIVSYWSVNDEATSYLMTSFYYNVSNKQTFSVCLQQAKLSLLNKKGTQAPYYWAGFVLIGE